MVLLGTADPNSPLRLLRGYKDVLKVIFDKVVTFWKESVDHSEVGFVCSDRRFDEVRFPKPTGIKINMMPFIMGKKSSLPKKYHQYWGMIESCDVEMDEYDAICYLTIYESETNADVCNDEEVFIPKVREVLMLELVIFRCRNTRHFIGVMVTLASLLSVAFIWRQMCLAHAKFGMFVSKTFGTLLVVMETSNIFAISSAKE